jgi:hypothetical protein
MLREIADAQLARLGASPVPTGQCARKQLHQRGLAGTIAAQQAEPVARGEREA